MKLKFLCFLFSVIFIICSGNVQAGHPIAMYLTYDCIGQDTFLIKLNVYNDCHTSFTPTQTRPIGYQSPCNSGSITLYLDTMYDATPVCTGQCSACDQGACSFNQGYLKQVYSDTLILPQDSCCEYTILYPSCCRSADATTIQNPTQQFRVHSNVNRCVTPCNNSIKFTDDPFLYLCKDDDVMIQTNVTEADGDSIVFERVSPLTLSAQSMQYISPFSAEEPFEYLYMSTLGPNAPFPGGLRFNTQTGSMQFRPVTNLGTIVAIKVSEYRDSVRVGYVTRDMLVKVMDCQNEAPVFQTQSTVKVCAGDTVNFTVSALDPDSLYSEPDSVFMELIEGPLGMELVPVNAPIKGEGVIKWITTFEDVGLHSILVKAYDNGCPIGTHTIRKFQIEVTPLPDIEYSTELVCSEVVFNAIEKQSNTNTNFHWTGDAGLDNNNQNFSYNYPDTGTYHFALETSIGICTLTYNDSIVLNKPWMSLNKSLNDTIYKCLGSIAELFVNVQNAIGPVKYLWSTGDSTDLIHYPVIGDTVIYLTLWDSINCMAYDTFFIKANSLPVVSTSEDLVVCENSQTIKPFATPVGGIWTGTGIVNDTIFDPAQSGTGNFMLIYTYTDSNECISNDSLWVDVRPLPEVDAGEDIQLCIDAQLFLLSPDPPGGVWSGTGIVNNNSIDPSLSGAGSFELLYSYNDGFGCLNYDTLTLDVYDNILVEILQNDTFVCENIIFELKATPEGGQWEGIGVEQKDDHWYFNASIADTGIRYVKYILAENLCYIPDSILIEVLSTPFAYFTVNPDSGITPLEVNFSNLSMGNEPLTFYWNFGTSDPLDFSTAESPVFTYSDSGQYIPYLIVTSIENNCKDSFYYNPFITVTKKPLGLINEIIQHPGIKIYPNPVENVLTITVNPQINSFKLNIFNIHGKIMFKDIANNIEYYTIDLSKWPGGMYVVMIYDNEDVILHIEKVVSQK